MSFTWIYPSSVGDYIQSEEIVEIRDNIETIKTSILNPTPASTESVVFNEPLADNIVAQDEVGDELQENLNTLRSENYCRGHHSSEHLSNNITDHVVVQSIHCFSDNPLGYASQYSTYHIAQHSDNKINNDSSNYGTNNATRG